MPVEAPAKPSTKEELEQWKRERAEKRKQGGTTEHPPMIDATKRKRGWEEDINLLVEFLQGVKKLMGFLIKDRVPTNPAKLFAASYLSIEENINDAISDLYSIDAEKHVALQELKAAGCTGKPLKLKLREYYRRITSGPVVAVLERVDSILRSLIPALATLEPVNEFKEALESRLKHDGDRGIISLNLSGREQFWNDAESE